MHSCAGGPFRSSMGYNLRNKAKDDKKRKAPSSPVRKMPKTDDAE